MIVIVPRSHGRHDAADANSDPHGGHHSVSGLNGGNDYAGARLDHVSAAIHVLYDWRIGRHEYFNFSPLGQ